MITSSCFSFERDHQEELGIIEKELSQVEKLPKRRKPIFGNKRKKQLKSVQHCVLDFADISDEIKEIHHHGYKALASKLEQKLTPNEMRKPFWSSFETLITQSTIQMNGLNTCFSSKFFHLRK